MAPADRAAAEAGVRRETTLPAVRCVIGTSRDRVPSDQDGREDAAFTYFRALGPRTVTLGQLRLSKELDLRKRMSTQDAPTQNFPRMTSVDHDREQQAMCTFVQVSGG